MPITYSPDGIGIKPYQLSDADLLAIGRIISVCADLEDLIDVYFCRLTGIPEGRATILFGRMSASAKVKLAETLAKAQGGDAWEMHKDCFHHQGYKDLIQCRNTVAHGQLLGLTDDGDIAFQVKEILGADENRVTVSVNAYPPETLAKMGVLAGRTVPKLEAVLQLGALRKKRRAQALEPHRKAQRQARQGATPQRPPQS